MMAESYTFDKVMEIKKERGLSAKQIVRLCDWPRSTVYSYLNGSRKISIEFLDVFCKSMEISLGEFYAGYDEMVRK